MRGSTTILACALVWAGLTVTVRAEDAPKLEAGVRGLVTRASGPVTIDGSLSEWSQAYCTPVHYNHRNLSNRAAQFFYMWDDEAFYVGLRCLDTKQANPSPLAATYNGDAVEFYLDTRPGDRLRGKEWSDGAIHFYFSAFQGKDVAPRWVIRNGIATSKTVLRAVEVAAKQAPDSYEVEFRLLWANFPEFTPREGAVMALDAELCSGDGASRTDRTFAYGSPLSVQQPASQGKVQLVRSFEPDYLAQVGATTFPFWVDTPWVQSERATVQGVVAIPPAFESIVGGVEVRIHDTEGKVIKTLPARIDSFGPKELGFLRAVALWPIDDFAPGTHFATARVSSRTGKTLATVAPRMVAEGIISGR